MSEKMLVTQALDERDLLVKKISDKIRRASFVDTVKRNEEKTRASQMAREAYHVQAEAAYQQIVDLISRFEKIDAAIVASNANTWIETSYGRYTVAGAISLRNRLKGRGSYEQSADFETELCSKMEREYQVQIQTLEQCNRQLQNTAEEMRLSILGRENKTKGNKPLEVVDAYVRENTTELVNPLDVPKKITILQEKRNTLLKELDTKIKVSNATTFVEW